MALAVKTAVKSLAKSNNMRVSGDFWKGLDEMLTWKIKRAAERARANGRKTLRASDL